MADLFTKEYNTGTIKLSVAYGTKRTILYYTKAITILVVSLITYLIFVATFFVIEIIQSGYIPTASEVINLLGWALACGTVLLALESISIFLCVVIQNTGIVTGICCLYVFSGASVYLMLWSDMETVSIPLKFFVYGNPMYYWMNFSSCRTMGIIEHLPFYFIGCISLLIVGGLIMIRKEIK
jgi:ABC-2 type transport system permease protein